MYVLSINFFYEASRCLDPACINKFGIVLYCFIVLGKYRITSKEMFLLMLPNGLHMENGISQRYGIK